MTKRLASVPWSLIYWTLTIVGIAYVVGIHAGLIAYPSCVGGQPSCDAASTYFVKTPYDWSDLVNGASVYRYSPAFLWITAPLRLLPWDVFQWVYIGLHIVALLWLRSAWMLAIPGMGEDLIRGNISTFIALAVVLAIRRWPAAWSFVLLTKVTPAVGLLWHLLRREWTALLVALGVTAAIIGLGFLTDAELWRQWFVSLANDPSTYDGQNLLGPLWFRAIVAVLIVVYAARANRAWVLPFAMILAAPGTWPYVWLLLAAIPRLLEKPATDAPEPQRGRARRRSFAAVARRAAMYLRGGAA